MRTCKYIVHKPKKHVDAHGAAFAVSFICKTVLGIASTQSLCFMLSKLARSPAHDKCHAPEDAPHEKAHILPAHAAAVGKVYQVASRQ